MNKSNNLYTGEDPAVREYRERQQIFALIALIVLIGFTVIGLALFTALAAWIIPNINLPVSWVRFSDAVALWFYKHLGLIVFGVFVWSAINNGVSSILRGLEEIRRQLEWMNEQKRREREPW